MRSTPRPPAVGVVRLVTQPLRRWWGGAHHSIGTNAREHKEVAMRIAQPFVQGSTPCCMAYLVGGCEHPLVQQSGVALWHESPLAAQRQSVMLLFLSGGDHRGGSPHIVVSRN